jgi:hypothetical protein
MGHFKVPKESISLHSEIFLQTPVDAARSREYHEIVDLIVNFQVSILRV